MPIKSNVGSFHISLWSPEQHFLFFSVPFFPFPILSDPACLPVPLGKSLPFLGHQLGRCFLSAPLDVGALVDPAWGLETVSRGLGMVRSRWGIASLEDVLLPPGEGEWELLVSVCFSWRGIDFALQILLFGACVGKAAPSRLKSKKHSAFFQLSACEIFLLFILWDCFYTNSRALCTEPYPASVLWTAWAHLGHIRSTIYIFHRNHLSAHAALE